MLPPNHKPSLKINCCKTTLLILAAMFLSACSGISKEECTTGDWQARGREDGAKGLLMHTTFDGYRKACQEHGATLDRSRYEAGFREGLVSFCSETRGEKLGAAGTVYDGVCTADLEPGFLVGYRKGLTSFCTTGNGYRFASRRKPYNGVCPESSRRNFLRGYVSALDDRLDQTRTDLSEAERRLRRAKRRLSDDEAELDHQRHEHGRSKPGSSERRTRHDIIKRLEKSNRRLSSDIRDYQKDLDDLKSDRSLMRSELNKWKGFALY